MPILFKSIDVPTYPQFMFSADKKTNHLYIICTKPLTLFWVRQTIPAQIYIVEGKQDRKLLQDCGEWYRKAATKNLGEN